MKRFFFFASFFLFFSSVLCGCGNPLYHETEIAMGTFVEVVSADPRAAAITFREFRRLDKIFSLYDETSELSRLNKTGELHVSDDLFEVVKKAKEAYVKTDGAFDATVGPLALLWKKAIRDGRLPDDSEVRRALSRVGMDKVALDEVSRTISLASGVMLDLGGIAKGYAVDKAVAKLREAGINSALVNAGGNMFCLGKNQGRPWRVGIRDPRIAHYLKGKIALEDRGVSTSGDYEQFFIRDKKRYSHIIDIKTGYPADSGIVSATVTAPDAMTADILSTTLVVTGKERGFSVLKRFPGASARLIDAQGDCHPAS